MQSREDLIMQLSLTGFAMDDIRLFLDTHPEDTRAIGLYNEYAAKYASLQQEYEDSYAGFNSYSSNNSNNEWLWNSYPMPWEGGMK
jgi:spore coat protein JB